MSNATFRPMGKEENHGNRSAGKEENHGNRPAGQEENHGNKPAGNEPFDKVKEAGAQALGKAQEAVASVGEMAGQTATALGKKADSLTSTAGHEVKNWADNLSKKAPHDGMLGHASQAVTDTLKEGGRYLEDAKLSGMAEDVTQLVRRHPVPAVLICLGIGFCVGRTFKS